MAIIELKNITGLLEATMSDYLDSAVVKEKTTRKELVSLLQATDESLDTVLNNMEGKVASINTLQHSLDVLKLENSKLSQELQDTAEGLAEVEAVVKSLEHDLGEAVLEKNSAEERAENLERELKDVKEELYAASAKIHEALQEERYLNSKLEGYKSRGFFARIFNLQP